MRNARVEWLKIYRPTDREVAWLAVWLVVTGVLFFGARRYLVFPVRPPVPPASAREERTFNLGRPESSEAMIPAAPAAAASRPTPSEGAMKAAVDFPGGEQGGNFLDNWRPDKEGRWGDAGRCSPEEERWLQEQLARIRVMQTLPPDGTLARVTELASWVGQIPYREKYRGWGRAEVTVATNEGDCQDKSLLLAQTLIAAGVTEVAICRGVPQGYTKGQPGHAWVQVLVGADVWRIETTSGQMWRANTGSPLDAFEPVLTVWRPTHAGP